MAFMNFLNRNKTKITLGKEEKLDVPPMPPPPLPKDAYIPPVPDFSKEKIKTPSAEASKLEPLPSMPPPDFSKEAAEVPPMPDFSKELAAPEEDKIPPIPDFAQEPAEISPEIPSTDVPPPSFMQDYEKPAEPLPPKEKPITEEPKKSIFLKVTNYKELIQEMSDIKATLRNSEESISKLYNIETLKEKEFDKWNNRLLDMNRKFQYMNKVLFKGG